jgi:hypothetical protein
MTWTNPTAGEYFPAGSNASTATHVAVALNGVVVWNRHIPAITGVSAGSGPVTVSGGTVSVDALSTSAATTADTANATAASAAATAAASALTAATAATTAAAGKVASAERSGNNVILKDAAGNTLSTIALGDLAVDVKADGVSIDGNFVMTLSLTDGTTKTVDLRTLKAVNTTYSITGNGDSSHLQLVGDAATPGPRKAYGTNAAGTKGFWRAPYTWESTPVNADAHISDKWQAPTGIYLPVGPGDSTVTSWVQAA